MLTTITTLAFKIILGGFYNKLENLAVKYLVDTSEGRDINGLSSDSTSTSDTGRIFTGTRVDNGLKENLDGVLTGGEVDDLESVLEKYLEIPANKKFL